MGRCTFFFTKEDHLSIDIDADDSVVQAAIAAAKKEGYGWISINFKESDNAPTTWINLDQVKVIIKENNKSADENSEVDVVNVDPVM